MNKIAYSFTLVLLCLVAFVTIRCSQDNFSGGSGAETGNAKIAGTILDTSGAPARHIEVFLYPSFYNPITDTPPDYPFIDTTDINGNYNFDVPDLGTYNILANQFSTDDKSITNVTVTTKSVNIPEVTLSRTGTLKILFAADNPMDKGSICLIGTPIRISVSENDISAGYVVMNSVPEGLYSDVYFSKEDNSYGATIASQITVKHSDTSIVNVCLCSLAAKGYDTNPPVPLQTQYISFGGQELKRYAWKGNYVSFLTKNSNLDACIMRRMLTVLDSAFIFNKDFLGQLPPLDKNYNGLLSITEVPYSVDGLFNGALGVSGIEMGEDQFQRLYNLASTQNSFPQELFFVLANNFNFYLGELTYYSNPKYSIAVTRGFSVFLRFVTMNHIGVKAAPIMNLSLDQYYEKVANLMNIYISDSSLSFFTAFAADTLPFDNLKSEHLFASMLLKLGKLYGDSTLQSVWKEIDKRPNTTSTQSAIDNLVLAFSYAAGVNVIPLFTEWRFPVSESAKIEAAKIFP